MFSRSKLFTLFTRPAHKPGGKDTTMPEPAPASTPAPSPANDSRDDLSRQLSTLTDAMRQLAESHKTLLEAVKAQPAQPAQPAQAPSAAPSTPALDIGGDPAGGGQRPGAVVDYSRLSPVQQITLGLKDTARGSTNRVSAGAD